MTSDSGTARSHDTERDTEAEQELVVLLDEDAAPIGTAPKSTVHTTETPLHLAFSCFVVSERGLLVTRRALTKRTWPGVWTNAVCGHPGPGEAPTDAVHRRAQQELGLRIDEPRLVLPAFRYRAIDASGVVENEVCPVFIAFSRDARLAPDPSEVAEATWTTWEHLDSAVTAAPYAFSPWLALELPELMAAGAAD